MPVAATQPRRVGARRAAAAARASRAARAATSCTRSARPRPARGRFARVTTIHDLNYLMVPDAHFGLRGLGMRVLVPLAARALAPRDRRLRVHAARPRGAPGHARRRRSTWCRSGSGSRRPRAPTPARRAARAARRSGDRPVVLSLSAKRPHKNLRGLLDALARIPAERRPVLVLPGYPTPHEAELRAHAAALGVADDVRFLGWTSPADVEGLFALCARVRVPVVLRGLRPAGARGDGARRAGGLLGPRLAARGGRATRRCCSTRTIPARSRRRSSGCSATRPRPSGCAPPAARGPRASRGRAPPELTLASYERALAAP